jgi:hypothetical protein
MVPNKKGQAYWRKVIQYYNERKLHKPFNIIRKSQ